MLTKAEHEALVAIVNNKGKKFILQKQNPLFPFTNSIECVKCLMAGKKHPRLVGYVHSNGKKGNSRKAYKRYRCRSCNLSIRQEDLHRLFNDKPLHTLERAITEEFTVSLQSSLAKVWRQAESSNLQLIQVLENELTELRQKRDNLLMSLATDSEEDKQNFKDALSLVKAKTAEVEGNLNKAKDREQDFLEFAAFGLNTVSNWTTQWWELDHSDRERCKQILFPAGFSLTPDKKVYTPEISIIYSSAATKKAPSFDEAPFVEGQRGLEPRTPCLRGRCSNQLSYWPVTSILYTSSPLL